MKKFKCCYLHIGTEKTGSTTIQRFLEKNRSVLQERGHCYPKSLGPPRGSHYYLVVYSRADDVFDDLRLISGVSNAAELNLFRSKLEEDLEQEFSNLENVDYLHVSTENCHSRLVGVSAIEKAKSLLSSWVDEFKVIIYLRPQHEVALSLYSTDMKLGGLKKNPLPDIQVHNHYYNYYSMLKKWDHVFGKSSLVVRHFSRDKLVNNDLIDDYLALTGLDSNGLQAIQKENESLSPEALEFLGNINKYLPRFVDNTPTHARKNIAEVMEAVFPGTGPVVSSSEAIAFYNIFKGSNDRLAEEYLGMKLLFEPDFTKYGDQEDAVTLDVDLVFQMIAEIWKAGRFTLD